MPNNNVLEGFRCPKCKSEKEFNIEVCTVKTFTDDGEGDEGADNEWQDNSYCSCTECDHAGKVRDFQIENQKKRRVKKSKFPEKNVYRAAWAKNALAVFTKETYSGDVPDTMHKGDFETAIQDLVSDLLHLWHQRRDDCAMTPRELLERGYERYAEEIADPNC